MKQHTLFYGSSYDSLHSLRDMIRLVYANERLYMRVLQKGVSRLSKSARKAWLQGILLRCKVQVRMEQNTTRVLERKEDEQGSTGKYEQEPCQCCGQEQPSVEWGTTNQQGWLCVDMGKRPSKRGLSRLRERASFGNGKKARKVFIANGSSASQEWEQAGQSHIQPIPYGKFIRTYKASLL